MALLGGAAAGPPFATNSPLTRWEKRLKIRFALLLFAAIVRTWSYGGGRVFYTALGHEEAVWRDPRFQQLLRNAALWVLRRG
jgi:type 1 glutamine amidotransferase